ncbi:unnamed protein product [Protopolystoma xenopodis]|uniref:Uncharacterized protein n=1 Tax=Protopolystoma xenopodis TaxID=117903 RepID=A0A448WJ75_9PLAT|nr:unnamed protein product [Protopolystoma xenopodis]
MYSAQFVFVYSPLWPTLYAQSVRRSTGPSGPRPRLVLTLPSHSWATLSLSFFELILFAGESNGLSLLSKDTQGVDEARYADLGGYGPSHPQTKLGRWLKVSGVSV